MHMGNHYLLFEVFDFIKPFLEEVIQLIFPQLEQSDVGPSSSKDADILIGYTVSVEVFHPVQLSKKISRGDRLMVSRDEQYFFSALFERPDNVFGALLHHRQVAAKNNQVTMLFFCPCSELFG